MGLLDKLKGITPASIVSETAGNVVAKVLEGADNLFTSKEEKLALQQKMTEELNRHEEAKEARDLEEIKAYLSDVQGARDSYTRIQESEQASWIAKNIMPILTIMVTVGFFGLLIYMLKYEIPKSNERIMDIMLGSLGTAWITMVGFYFGSSKSSEEKQRMIHKMLAILIILLII